MHWIVWVLVGLLANAVLGSAVMAAIDRDGRLLAWYKECPSPWLAALVLECWPVMVWAHYCYHPKEQAP